MANPVTDKPTQDDIGARGAAYYENALRTLLEPGHCGQFVAIHPDTQDYTVAPTSGDALRALYARHSEGGLMVRRIGDAPEYGLAARIFAGETPAGQAR